MTIKYWLLADKTWFIVRKPKYFCFAPPGIAADTDNPKLAMRWFNELDAQAYADRLVQNWTPVEIEFDGDEPVSVWII